ncbi:MAG: GNAT family N-acetyltransferase [Isosphaeraceae bacterium]
MPRSAPEPLRLFLRDEFGTIQGGLLASTRWHWLLIDVLWVTDEHRGQGFGSALLERAETITSFP